MKEEEFLNRDVLNADMVSMEAFTQYFLQSQVFIEISKKCNYSVKNFQKYIGDLISENAGFIKNDFDIKCFVAELCILPYNIDKLTDNEVKFLSGLSKRYLVYPIRFDAVDYLKENRAKKLN